MLQQARLVALSLAIAMSMVAAPAAAQPADGPDIVVLGGPAAVGVQVESALAEFGAVSRLSGASRYDTAVAISQARHPDGAPVAFVATGNGFADALALGPVAARAGGPILLVPSASVPDAVAAELSRLAPSQIVIAGGVSVITDAVADELEAIAPIRRLAGADRFETAAVLAEESHPEGADTVVIARADDFADALAAGPAATANDAPILLTHRSRLPDSTIQAISDLGADTAILAGGEAVTMPTIAEQLADHVSVVNRVSGPNRFATAAAFAALVFEPGEADTVFIASGRAFPDALSGAAAASAPSQAAFAQVLDPTGPILLVEPDRLPDETREALERAAGLGVGVAENGAPVAVDVSATVGVGASVQVPLQATDPDGDPLTYSLTSPPSVGSASLSGSTVTYTPGTAGGVVTFTYTASDGVETSEPATITVTITAGPPVVVNNPPTADPAAATTDEDTPVVITPVTADPEGAPITLAIDTLPADGTASVGPGAGEITYTPAPDATTPVTFTYVASDGALASPPATVSITITPVNDAPVADDLALTTVEDNPVSGTAIASDIDSGALTFSLDTPPTAALGTATVSPAGVVDFTPTLDATGVATFAYAVTDGALSDTGQVQVTITPVNDAPVLSAPAVQPSVIVEDTPTTISLSVSDVDDAVGDLSVLVVSGPANGALTPTGTLGEFTYTPDPNVNGADSFTARARDDDGATSALTTVTIDVTATPDAPTADAQLVTIAEDSGGTVITLTGSDPDGDALTFALIVPAPTLGTLSAVTPLTATSASVTYTPSLNANGTDSFQFTVDDTTNPPASATVTVDITPVNDPPVADDEAYDFAQNTPLIAGTPPGAPTIANTTTELLLVGDSDPVEGSPVAVVPHTGATTQGGQVQTFSDGAFIYTPPAGPITAPGTDTFTYTITDGGLTDTGTVTLTQKTGAWFVDDSGAAGGDGRAGTPFTTLASAEAASVAGDTIFVHAGTYDESITLKDQQALVGEESGLTLLTQTVVAAGTAPTIGKAAGNGVTLGSGNTVRGLDIRTGGAGIAGTTFGTATFTSVGVTAADALDLDSGTIASGSTFDSLNASGAAGGISLTTVSGDFDSTTTTVTGTVAGIVIDGVSTVDADFGAAQVTSTVASSTGVSLASTAVPTARFNSLGVDVVGAGITATGEGLVSSAPITVSSDAGPALDLQNTADLGPLTFGAIDVSAGTSQGIRLTGGPSQVTFGSTVTIQAQTGVTVDTRPGGTTSFDGPLLSTAVAGPALSFDAAGTVTIANGTADATGGPALAISTTTIGAPGVTLASASSTSAVAEGLLLDTVSGGTVAIDGGTITGAADDGIRIATTSAPVTLTGMTVSGSGDAADEHAVSIINGSGTATISGGSFSSATDTPLVVSQTTSGTRTLVIDTSASVTSTAPIGHAIHLAAIGAGATINGTMTGGTVTGGAINGVYVETGNFPTTSGAVTARLDGVTVTGAPTGVHHSIEGTGTGGLTVVDGNIVAGDGLAVSVRADDDATSTALIENNTLIRDDAGFGGDVVRLAVEGALVGDTPTLQATVHNNRLQPSAPTTGVPTAGLLATSRRGADLDLQLSSNTLGAFAAWGLEVVSGTSGGEAATTCLSATGNGLAAAPDDLRLRQRAGATFGLAHAFADGTSAPQVEAALAAANAAGFTVDVDTLVVNYTPNATCTTPTPEGP